MKKKPGTIKDILGNKISGSAEITSGINDFLDKNARNFEDLKNYYQQINKKRHSFEAINSYLRKLEKMIRSGNEAGLKAFFKAYKEKSRNNYKKIYTDSKHLLKNKNKVLTISNSRTVLEFLKLWRRDNKNLAVIISESRPMNEGQLMAKSLLREGIKVTLITDFNISNGISISDAVIIGADFILKNGDVVNKTGSRAAAIICGYFKKPFYVIAASDKISKKKSYKPGFENPDEVWNFRNKNLEIKNNYFEVIEKKLITKILSEEKK